MRLPPEFLTVFQFDFDSACLTTARLAELQITGSDTSRSLDASSGEFSK